MGDLPHRAAGRRVPLRTEAAARRHGGRLRLRPPRGPQWVLLVPAGGAATAADTARQWLGDHFSVLERTVGSIPGPYGKKVRALAGEVWLVRPDAHLAWRGQPDSPDLGRWLEGALRRGHARR